MFSGFTLPLAGFGGFDGHMNADQLQGVDVSPAAPNDNDVLTYDAGTNQWQPEVCNAAQIRGRNVQDAAPNDDDVLVWNTVNARWQPEVCNAVQLQARTVGNAAPSDGDALVWNNGTSQWEPQAVVNTSDEIRRVAMAFIG